MNQPYFELLSNRPPAETTYSYGPIATGSNIKVAYHMIFIPWACEVFGYHLSAAYSDDDMEIALPSDGTNARFWVQTADTDTYFPDRVIPLTDTCDLDTGNIYAIPIGFGSPYHLAPPIAGADWSLDIILVNPVRIDTPGLYWIGWAHMSTGAFGEGRFLASTVSGMPHGLKDLAFTGSTPTNAQGPCYSSWSIPEQLYEGNVEISEDRYPNIRISLIAQQLTPAVPLGGPYT